MAPDVDVVLVAGGVLAPGAGVWGVGVVWGWCQAPRVGVGPNAWK